MPQQILSKEKPNSIEKREYARYDFTLDGSVNKKFFGILDTHRNPSRNTIHNPVFFRPSWSFKMTGSGKAKTTISAATPNTPLLTKAAPDRLHLSSAVVFQGAPFFGIQNAENMAIFDQ